MPNVGPMELVIFLVIALLVLGPKRLPEVGRSVGRGLREFKDGLSSANPTEELGAATTAPQPAEPAARG